MAVMQGEIKELIKKYLEGAASVDEINQLENWYNTFEQKANLYQPGTVESEQALTSGFDMLMLKIGLT